MPKIIDLFITSHTCPSCRKQFLCRGEKEENYTVGDYIGHFELLEPTKKVCSHCTQIANLAEKVPWH